MCAWSYSVEHQDPLGVTALRSLLRSFELHAELRVLNAQRYPLSVELFVTLVLLDLTPNLADPFFANVLSPASHIKGVTELIVRPRLLLRILVLPG